MATGRSLQSAALAALVLVGSGCTLYQPRPVTFRVRDGDTGQPIAGARVEAQYWAMLDFGVWFASVGPRDGVTDRDGNLTLVIDPRKWSFHLRVTADGYPEDGDLVPATYGSPRWDRLMPGPWYSPWDEYQVRLYRGPKPTADVTVPDGYRGAVLVRFAPGGEPPALAGQRAFAYPASPRGVAEIRDGGFFEAVGSYAAIRARYAGRPAFPTYVPGRHGPAPPGAPEGHAVALRFVTPVWEQHTWLYVLGTAAEAEEVERAVWPDPNHFDQAAFDRIVEAHGPPATAPRP
jgi:hypothetical protein